MIVCKHGSWQQDVSLFAWKHKFEKGFELKNSSSLLYLPISSSAETWKIFRNMQCQFFCARADILSEKNSYLESIFSSKQGLITRQSFVYKTSRLVWISLLISALNKRVLLFCSWKLFYKSKHILIETLEGLGKFLTVMQTLDFVSGFHNCLEFSQSLSCLYQAMQTWKTFSIAKLLPFLSHPKHMPNKYNNNNKNNYYYVR